MTQKGVMIAVVVVFLKLGFGMQAGKGKINAVKWRQFFDSKVLTLISVQIAMAFVTMVTSVRL